LQREFFLFGSGTIEIVFGFIGMVAQSKRVATGPSRGPGIDPGPAGFVSRGIALQPGQSSSKRGKPAKDEKGKKGGDEAMGSALRSVYDNTVSEPVPDQMLDLLRKLD
jgi:hypothetical protein